MKTRREIKRRCIGCQEAKDKRDLIRVVRTPEGTVEIDRTGRKSGRGAYLCPNPECLAKAMKTKALERSLMTEVRPEVYEALKKELTDG